MKINISIAGRYKDRDDVKRLFDRYAERLRQNMKLLSRRYGFRAPEQIILRPKYVRKDGYYPYHGSAIWNYFKGFTIAMTVETCMQQKDKGMSVLDEECAHIANLICHDDFGHGKSFKAMYAACRNKKK